MSHPLTEAIDQEAIKLVRRHELHAKWVHDENVRRARRTTTAVTQLEVRRPGYWTAAPGFDPYLVRSRADRISHSIRSAARDHTYSPHNPVAYEVPKADGSVRRVSVFQVADNALSRLTFQSLLAKNRAKLSSRSYAYRSDVTAHDALQYLQSELSSGDRMFIAEYDFSKYFDGIGHDYIRRVLSDERYLLTKAEMRIVEAFMCAPLPAPTGAYGERGGQARNRGLPQGTSISLFLANLAATPLDRALERLGVGFVRYADDTMIWSRDYGALCRGVDELHKAASAIGSEVNLEKSPGVRLLVAAGAAAEIKSTTYTEFIGYRISAANLEMKAQTMQKAKARIRELLYFNLLDSALKGVVNPQRIAGGVDRDYVVFIWQLRRFLYGDLSERDLRRFQSRGVPMRRFKGLMSFYPLIDDTQDLLELDRWLARETWLTLRKRSALLRSSGMETLPPPHDLRLQELIRYQGLSGTTGERVDLQLPSFRRIANVIRRAAREHGPNRVGNSLRLYDY
jgi:RNA-directed DNA polymerase